MAITHETPTQEQSVQSPSVSKPESGRTTMEWVRNHRGALTGAGGVALGAALAVGIMGGEKGGNEPAPENTTITTANPTPGESAPPTTNPTPETSPTNIPEQNGDSTEVLVQTTSLEAMRAMSLDEFVKLPFADRYAYSILTMLELGYPEENLMDESNDIVPQYPDIVTREWDYMRGTAINLADADTRAKLTAGMEYYTTSAQTGEMSDSFRAISTDFVSMGGEYESMDTYLKFIDSGEMQSGTDRNGNPIEFMNVTYQTTDFTSQEVKGPLMTAQAIRTVVELQDGRQIVTYPRGYETEGQQSPVEGYDY